MAWKESPSNYGERSDAINFGAPATQLVCGAQRRNYLQGPEGNPTDWPMQGIEESPGWPVWGPQQLIRPLQGIVNPLDGRMASTESAGCSANIPALSVYFPKETRRHAKGMSRVSFGKLEPTVPALPAAIPTGIRSPC